MFDVIERAIEAKKAYDNAEGSVELGKAADKLADAEQFVKDNWEAVLEKIGLEPGYKLDSMMVASLECIWEDEPDFVLENE